MNKWDTSGFASVLESSGYRGAQNLIDDTLVPLAQRHGISLLSAAREYANAEEEQDTSWFQLFQTLREVDEKTLHSLDIHSI